MKNTLIVCEKCGSVHGCINGDGRWDCGLCERLKNKAFQICPWNSWGGKAKKKLNGQPMVNTTCSSCAISSRGNNSLVGAVACRPPRLPKVFIPYK